MPCKTLLVPSLLWKLCCFNHYSKHSGYRVLQTPWALLATTWKCTFPKSNISEEENRIWHISFKGTDCNYRIKIASGHDRQGRKTFPTTVTAHAEGGAETVSSKIRNGEHLTSFICADLPDHFHIKIFVCYFLISNLQFLISNLQTYFLSPQSQNSWFAQIDY